MLEKFKAKLIDAGWNLEPGNSVAPDTQVPTTDVKVLWVATKSGTTLILTSQWARVIKSKARWAKTPIDMVLRGHIMVPGIIGDQCERGVYTPGNMISHEGCSTAEEREIISFLEEAVP